MKLDQLSELAEELEDLEFLKEDCDARIAQIELEATLLHATDRQPFEDQCMEFIKKSDTVGLTKAEDAEFDLKLKQMREYSATIIALAEERKQLIMKTAALDEHIATRTKVLGNALLNQEINLKPSQTASTAESESIPSTALPESDSLNTLSEQWIQHKIRHGELKERSETTYRQAFAKFFDILGADTRLRKFSKQTAVQYVDELSDYPHNRWKGKGRDKMSLAEVRNIESKRLSTSAIDDEIRIIGGMFEWFIVRGYINNNPLKGLAPKVNKADLARESFEPEEVIKILSHPCFRGERPENWRKPLRPLYYWLPILAIFTGARVEELSRLRKKDIKEMHGIMAIEIMASDLTPEITSRRKSTPGKSASASRVIPVHTQLAELGFLDFVNSRPDDYLFDQTTIDYRRSHGASRDIANIFREAGVDKTMHQLRHTMRDILTEGEVDWAITQGIMGHSPSGQSASYGKKIKQNIKALAPAYQRLDFSHLICHVAKWGKIKEKFSE